MKKALYAFLCYLKIKIIPTQGKEVEQHSDVSRMAEVKKPLGHLQMYQHPNHGGARRIGGRAGN